MLEDLKREKLIFWSFLSLYAYEILVLLPKMHINISASLFFALLYASLIIMIMLYRRTEWKQDIPIAGLYLFYVMMFWNLVCIVRGVVTANGYFDQKTLFTEQSGGFALLVPLTMMVGMNFLQSKKLINLCLTILAISLLCIPLSFTIEGEIYPRLVIPVIFFVLFIPYMKSKHAILTLVIAGISAVIALSWRANVAHIGLSLLMLGIYYFRNFIPKLMLGLLQIAFFILPFYYLYQGVNGDSIFAKNEETEIMVSGSGEQENFTADTRTDLYQEVLSDLYNSGDIWLGRGAIGEYKTEHDWELLFAVEDQRGNVEVGFLKMLIQCGVLGFILYGLVLAVAIYTGTFQTNNTLTKILAMFLASHWLMMFMENMVSFNMYFYFSWLVTGICFSGKVREMTDDELKQWFRFA